MNACVGMFLFLTTGLLAAACSGDNPLAGSWDTSTTVCVDGDAGYCCQVLYDGPVCDDDGCEPFDRSATRCISCQAWVLAIDGSAGDSAPDGPESRPPNEGPPQPPPDASAEFVETCGPATYGP